MFILCNTCGNKPSGISLTVHLMWRHTNWTVHVSRCQLRQPGLCALLLQLNHPACGHTLCFKMVQSRIYFLSQTRKPWEIGRSKSSRTTMASTSPELSAVGNHICADRGWPSSSRRSFLRLLSVQHGSQNLPCTSDLWPIYHSPLYILHHPSSLTVDAQITNRCHLHEF